MLKKMTVLIIVMIMVISICACQKSVQTAETEPAIKEEIKPTPEPALKPTLAATKEPKQEEEPATHEDEVIVSSFLDGGKIVFMEDAKKMDENNGVEFGEISKKQMGHLHLMVT